MNDRLADRSPGERSLSTNKHTLADGRTLSYATGGDPDGFPVVVHHGTPGSRLFGALLSDVASDKRVRLIVPDRPGYGYSSPPPSEWTRWDWKEDVIELLETEAISEAAVLGFSGGGPFAVAAADDDRLIRLGLLSAVVPPAENGLTRLSRIPFALGLLFRLSESLTTFLGPEVIVQQYTNRSVPETVAKAVADDFQEALRQGVRAPSRETRSFATDGLDLDHLSIPVRAWHGTRDENTPVSPVRSLVRDLDGTLVTSNTDHLGTLRARQRDIFEWIGTA